jgi:hypothetical protein
MTRSTRVRARVAKISRSLLRSGNFFLQKYANLRHAPQDRIVRYLSEKQAAQNREKLRNPFSLNYKSAALNQLSYAGIFPYESRY